MAYTKYSLTPANNNAAPPDGAPEGMLPSAVNDTMRDMMAQIRDCGDGIRGGTYTMTAPVITGGSINGAPVGASSASTGAFTTLSASSTVSGTGFSNYFASPPALGGTAAAAVSSTNLSYTGTLTGGTGAVNLGSGQFVKTSAGNVGIGSSSPISILEVTKSGITNMILGYNGTSENYYDANTQIFRNAASSTEYIRVTSAGNIGINGAPSAWIRRVVQINDATEGYFVSTTRTALGCNYYYDGTGKYIQNGFAGAYEQSSVDGIHRWFNASSGTANGTITFTQALTLNTTGNLVLQGGTSAANGTGVTFPATQSASNDANCLDDYEEGTWTPALGATTTDPTVTYSGRNGQYTRVGNIVNWTVWLAVSTISGGSGTPRITGLPFTVGGAVGYSMSNGWYSGGITGVGASYTYPIQYTTPGATNMELLVGSSGTGTWAVSTLTIGNITAGFEFRASGCYQVA